MGGIVVTENDICRDDILLKAEKIVCIGKQGLSLEEDMEVIDVSGRLIMPGVIDAHTHFTSPHVVDAVWTGSNSAAYGGVTTFVDFASMNQSTIKRKDRYPVFPRNPPTGIGSPGY